jgi:hypothetical protein
MPSRRTLLGTVACTLVAGCSRPGDTASGTDTPTPTTVDLSPVDPGAVPDAATVGLFSEASEELESATRNGSADVTDHRWAPVLRAFDCFAYEGGTYEVTERTTGSGGYVNEYSVSEVDEPGNESTVRVVDLPDSDRRAVVDAIATGEHTYDSDEGGFEPTDSVYAYNGSYYAFSQEVHGDKPVVVTYTLEATNADRCVTLEPLSLTAADAGLDTARQPDAAATVTGDPARTLAASDAAFVVRGGTCYELSARADDTED